MPRPRVFCDFNKQVDRHTYGLNTVGTAEDAERLGLQLAPGLELTLYDGDALDDGRPAWILADGVVVMLPSGTLAARVDPASGRVLLETSHHGKIIARFPSIEARMHLLDRLAAHGFTAK